MHRWQERIVWAVAVCATLGLWATVGAQNGAGPAGPSPSIPVNVAAGTYTENIMAVLTIDGLAGDDSFMVDLVGEARISNTMPRTSRGTTTFDTEMVSGRLTGVVVDPSDPSGNTVAVMIRESPTKASVGRTSGKTTASTASSFFDIWAEISTDGGQTWMPIDQLLHVEAMITEYPALEQPYIGPFYPFLQVPLKNAQGNVFGHLTNFKLIIVEPSHAIIKREIIELDRKLNLLLQQQGI